VWRDSNGLADPAAARALAKGDVLGAPNWVALRDDVPMSSGFQNLLILRAGLTHTTRGSATPAGGVGGAGDGP
jgi:hypothetical protein